MNAQLLSPAEKQTFNEYAVIAAALQPYIDAVRTGNGSGQRDFWFDHAHVVGSLDGQAINLNADAFADLPDTVGGSPDVQTRIVSIDHQGTEASARVELFGWGGVRYTDFFVL